MPNFCIPSPSKSSRASQGNNVFGGPSRMVKGRPIPRKLVVLGDGACGKTSMLTVFTQGFFPTDYEPTVFENYVEILQVDGQSVELSLWDTAGQEEFDRLRSLSYADTHVVMLCFSVDRPESLENIESKWIDEVMHFCPGVRIILVALKCDLRDDPSTQQKLLERRKRTLGYEEGLEVAKRIKASRYLECSAKMNRGVREAIQEAAKVALAKTRPSGNGSGGGGGEGVGGVLDGVRRKAGGRCLVM